MKRNPDDRVFIDKRLAGKMSQWASGGAISTLSSYGYAGKPVPVATAEAARAGFAALLVDAKANKYGWGPKDVRELQSFIRAIDTGVKGAKTRENPAKGKSPLFKKFKAGDHVRVTCSLPWSGMLRDGTIDWIEPDGRVRVHDATDPAAGSTIVYLQDIEKVKKNPAKSIYKPARPIGAIGVAQYNQRWPASGAKKKRNPSSGYRVRAYEDGRDATNGRTMPPSEIVAVFQTREAAAKVARRLTRTRYDFGVPNVRYKVETVGSKQNPVKSWIVTFASSTTKETVNRIVERWEGKLKRGTYTAMFRNQDDAKQAVALAKAWGIHATMTERVK